MKNMTYLLTTLFGMSLLASPLLAQDAKEVLEVTDDSEFEFTAYKLIGKQECSFLLYEGTVTLTGGKIESAVIEGLVDTDSVLNKSKTLTKILKSDKFFDSANHPECSFTSTKIEKATGDNLYNVTGDLEIKGISKSITFPATITFKNGTFSMDASWNVDRNDWKLSYKGLGDNAIKDTVEMHWIIVAEK